MSEAAADESTTAGLEDMTWRDVADAVRSDVPLVLPVGSMEQHGHHLPLGTDGFLVHELARRVGRRHALVIAPPLFFAARSNRAAGATAVPSPARPASGAACSQGSFTTWSRIICARVFASCSS